MSLLPPDAGQRPPLPLGARPDGSFAEAGGVGRTEALKESDPAPRSRRSLDYRLRGLDLGAQSVSEAPARPIRREPPGRRRRRRRLVQSVVLVAVAAVVAVALRASVVEPFSVPSASMVPTLQVGDRILVVKSSLLRRALRTGQIVVVRQPAAFSCGAGGGHVQDLVKRVIGLPGQTIWSTAETIYIDGKRLDEAGWYNPPFGQLGPNQIVRTKIPSGSYFVMGDNRTDSCDSRSFGPVSGSLILGQVVATIMRNGHPYVHSL